MGEYSNEFTFRFSRFSKSEGIRCHPTETFWLFIIEIMSTSKELYQLKKELHGVEYLLSKLLAKVEGITSQLQVKIDSNTKVPILHRANPKIASEGLRLLTRVSGNEEHKVISDPILYNNIILKIPPNLEDVVAYCKKRKNKVDPIQFFNFYDSKGWMIGKNKMKNWKAAVHTWERYKSAEENKPPIYDDGIKYVWDSKSGHYRHSKSGAIYIP